MNLELYTGGMVATNGYLLHDGATTLLIDAPAGVHQWLQQKDLLPDHLLLTHQHFDHVEDAYLFDCPVHAFADFNRDFILDQRAREWGLPVKVTDFKVSKILEKEEKLVLGSFQFELLHVPGHSPDSLVYSLPQAHLAIVGDTLFNRGYGRTDLPGGDEALLFQGIREKLLSLPPETRLYPGHGPATTPAAEQHIC